MKKIEIRHLHASEYDTWLRFRELLWPDFSREELSNEQQEILADTERNCILVAALPTNELVGFVEVAIRDWAEGCSTRPVGYIEGWYVVPEYRQTRIGRKLIDAAEAWALSRGCKEMGSDTEITNDISQRSHRSLGYEEVTRLVLFSKRLSQ